MARILPKILCSVNHIALTAKVVNPVRNALGVDAFLGALAEILLIIETLATFYAHFEHFTRLLAQRRMGVMIWLKKSLPRVS